MMILDVALGVNIFLLLAFLFNMKIRNNYGNL